MAAKKKTQKKIKLTFQPIASGAKELNCKLKTKKYEERDGREVLVTVSKIEGLPQYLTVKRGEVIEVTQAQCDKLEDLGFVETEEEYKERQKFVDNLENQHPDKLSFDQLKGLNGGELTMRDSQKTVYMDKLIRL